MAKTYSIACKSIVAIADAECLLMLPQICKSNQEMNIIFKSNASANAIHNKLFEHIWKKN